MTTLESICAQFDAATLGFLPQFRHPSLTTAEIEAIIAAYINYQIWGSSFESQDTYEAQTIKEFNRTPYVHTEDFHAPWLWLNNTPLTEKDECYHMSLYAYQSLMQEEGFLEAVNKNSHTNNCNGNATFAEQDAYEVITAFIAQYMAA